VGVTLNTVDYTSYAADGSKIGEAHSDSSNRKWLPLYIPPYEEVSMGAGQPCNRRIVSFTYPAQGIDDNGHEFTVTAEFSLR